MLLRKPGSSSLPAFTQARVAPEATSACEAWAFTLKPVTSSVSKVAKKCHKRWARQFEALTAYDSPRLRQLSVPKQSIPTVTGGSAQNASMRNA